MDILLIIALILPFLGKFRKIATLASFILALAVSIKNNYFVAGFFFALSIVVLWISKWRAMKYPLFYLAMFDLIGLLNSKNFLELYIYFELAVYASYFLVTSQVNPKPLFRYFVVNSVGSALMLLSIAVSYLQTGILTVITKESLIFFSIGLLIKLGIAPFQDWLAEIYKTVSVSAIIFFSAVLTEVSPLALLFAITSPSVPLQIFAMLSMSAANLIALKETSLKRILALFDASNLAYDLLAIAVATSASRIAALYMMLSHVVSMTFAFIALDISKSTKLNNLKAPLGMELPFYTAFFALSGLPPFHMFPAKMALFTSVFIESRILSYILIGNLALGAASSLRIISSIKGTIKTDENKKYKFLMYFLLVASIIFGLFPKPFFDAVSSQMGLFIR
jgi:NADH-quinone oxidoreductase subunit N